MNSYQHLDQLKELYILKSIGIDYIDPIIMASHSDIDDTVKLPNDLNALHKLISSCHLCDLSKSRHTIQIFEGHAHSGLMVINDFPSLAQDNDGMFAGKSGQMLKDMIEKVVMLKIEDVYFTHAVKCMPAAGKKPLDNECKSCQSFYKQQIEIIKPKIILALGSFSYNLLTNGLGNFEKDKGVIIPFGDTKLITIEHPQTLIFNPDNKAQTMQELKQIKSYLCEN